MTPESITIPTPDGWQLQCQLFIPPMLRHPSPVLCLHGFSQSHRTWTEGEFVSTLFRWGHAVIVPDLRGHGHSRFREPHSRGVEWDWDLASYRVDVGAVMEWVLRRWNGAPVTLCGHSLGGLLSIAETLKRGSRNVRGLVVLATPTDLSKTSLRLRLACGALLRVLPQLEQQGIAWRKLPMDRFFQLYDHLFFSWKPGLGALLPLLARWDRHHWLMPMWDPAHLPVSTVRRILSWSFPEPMSVVAQLARAVQTGECRLGEGSPDLNQQLSSLAVPVLSVAGMDDFVAPPETSEALTQQLTSPALRLVLARTHHVDMTAGLPAQEILRSMRDWLWNSSYND